MPYLYKIISTKLPPCLYELIPPPKRSHRYPSCFQTCRMKLVVLLWILRLHFFKICFYRLPLLNGINWILILKNIDSHAMFRKKLLTFIRPLENDTYGIYDPLGVRLLNRLNLGFRQLRNHKFRHHFADTLNPLCSCSLETEDTEHYFLRWQNNLSFYTTFMNDLNNINTAIASLNPDELPIVILYGDKSFNR